MAGNRPLWRWWIALVGGALAGAALPPWGCPPLLWLALLPLWAFGPGPALVWGAAAVLVSHRWLLWLHPLDWVGVPLPLSLPLCLLLWLAIGLMGAGLVGCWRWLVQRLGAERLSTACVTASLWGLAEVLLAKGPLFWIGLGSAVLPGDRALAGLAQLVGAGGLAALQLLLSWWLWRWLSSLVAQRSGAGRSALAWLALVLLLHGWGWWLVAAEQRVAEAADRSLSLLVLQPAIPTREKFSWLQQQALKRRLSAAQGQAEALGVDALVLPEGALALGEPLPRAAGVEVLSGGFRQRGERLHSSLLRFAPGSLTADQALDKHRLVPLGEWIPAPQWLAWSGLSAVGGIDPGAASRLLPRTGGAVAVAICYELADGTALAAASREGALWLLASANLDPYPSQLQRQFEALAQLRALESSRWLVSAANTGPSLVVNPAGEVLQRLPAGAAGTLAVTISQRKTVTAYGHLREWPLLLLGLAGGTARLRSGMRQS